MTKPTEKDQEPKTLQQEFESIKETHPILAQYVKDLEAKSVHLTNEYNLLKKIVEKLV